ncbi:MAG: bile acid:sodium symporter family protein [Pseudomonadota bacterium]
MEFLINVVLPLSLAVIMLSLGVGLTLGDFARVLTRPKAFAIGAVSQVALLPQVAYGVVAAFGIAPELAVGFMLLALCPGGVTSNMISRLANGDVALSVSLTAVISLLGILTIPLLTAWSVAHFLGADAPPVSITDLSIAVFLITTVPVAIGVAIRHFAPGAARAIDRPLSMLATILFVIIVIAALAGNWALFVDNVATLGPALIALLVGLMVLGLLLARAAALSWPETKTISIETGIQNATLGIALAGIIAGQTQGFSTFALPAAVYGILMYLVAAPFVAWFRTR